MPLSLTLAEDTECFVCGKSNLHGLRLDWISNKGVDEAVYYPIRTHQGSPGLVHGGILAAILDEGISRLAKGHAPGSGTAELTVRHFNPARIGEKLLVSAAISSVKGRLITGKAEIRNSKGRLVATASGKAIKPKSLLPIP